MDHKQRHAISFGHTKPVRPLTEAIRTILASCACGLAGTLVVASVHANPQGGVVVQGKASIQSPLSSTLDIFQSSQRAVIDWRTFSIAPNETVNFFQPSSSSATLNRVLGDQTSIISGALNANGQVFLINSSGILFGKTAKVDVNGLIASTSSIANGDFMAGRLNFSSGGTPSASIQNQGTISVRDGGFAALVAPNVQNAGVINARLGRIALAGGDTFTVDLYGDRLINFAISGKDLSPTKPVKVEQSGTLIADGGQIQLTAAAANAIVGSVVNMSGLIEARSVGRGPGGEIILDAATGLSTVSGRIDVSSAEGVGGTVDIYGGQVALTQAAQIDASGMTGGGLVQIGGGTASTVTPRALTTTIAAGASVDADAMGSGRGGTVSVWGTQENSFGGNITAAGGQVSGSGGFVDISTHGVLQLLGSIVTTAQHGAAGTILLDPSSVTIQASGSSSTTASVIDGNYLTQLLRSGQNVVIDATTSITDNYIIDGRPLSGTGNQTALSGQVEMTAGAIFINQPVITNNAPITLTATSGDVAISGAGFLYVANGTGKVGNAAINVTAAGAINAPGGAGATGDGQLISLGTITLHAAGSITLGAALAGLATGSATSPATGVGALVVTSTNGEIQMAGVDAAGQIALNSAAGVANVGSAIVAGGPVTINGGTGPVTIGANGSNGNVAGLETTGTAPVDIETSGAVNLNQSILTAGGAVSIGAAVPVGTFAAGSGAIIQTGGSGAVGINSAGAVTLNGLTVGGAATVTGSSIINSGGPIFAGGSLTLNATGSGASAIDIGSVAGGALGVSATGGIAINTNGGVDIDSGILATGGDLNIGGADAMVASLTTGSSSVLQAVGNSASSTPNVALYSSGAISLHGITSAGKVTVVGASISDAANSIVGAGEVSLNAGAGTIELSCIGSASNCGTGGTPQAAVSAGGLLTLTTLGAVILDSSLDAAGTVSIGAPEQRASSVTMAAGTTVQAGTDMTSASGISIYTSGPVTAQGLIVGEAGAITIDAENAAKATDGVMLGQGIGGFIGSTGVGSLSISSDSAISLTGATSLGTVTLSGATITDSTASIKAGGNVALTASSSVVGGNAIQLNNIGANVAGIDVTGTGAGVTLNLPGSGAVTLDSGIQTADGPIQIGLANTRAGSLTTAADAALIAGGGSNRVLVYAAGDVALNGITAGGDVTVDTLGLLKISTRSVASGGNIMMTAGSGANQGIDVTQILDSTGAIAAGISTSSGTGTVTLTTQGTADQGPVNLSSGISTAGGAITIGSSSMRAGNVTLNPGVLLATTPDHTAPPVTGFVSIYSSADVDAQSTGTQAPRDIVGSAVTIDATGSVNLDGLFGFAALSTAQNPTPNPFGIGSLTVKAGTGGSVTMKGAETSGPIQITAGGTITSLGSSDGGGSSNSATCPASSAAGCAGSIMIGAGAGTTPTQSVASLTMNDSSGPYSMVAPFGNVSIYSSGSVQIGGIAAGTLATPMPTVGNVYIVAGDYVDALSGIVAGNSSATAAGTPGGNVYIDVALNSQAGCQKSTAAESCITEHGIFASGAGISASDSNAVHLIVPDKAEIDVLGPIYSGNGPVTLGLQTPLLPGGSTSPYGPADTNAQIDLSDNIVTNGFTVNINGDVTLFKGVSLSTIYPGADDAPINRFGQVLFNTSINFDTGNIGCGNFCQQTGGGALNVPNNPVPGIPSYQWVDTGQQQSDGQELYYVNLNKITSFYDVAYSSSFFNFVGGLVQANGKGQAINGTNPAYGLNLSDPTTWNGSSRVPLLTEMLGVLTASIDTTNSGKAPIGANVTVAGNVSRYVPTYIACTDSACNNALVLPDSHINVALNVNVGTGANNAFNVMGSLGDTVASVYQNTGNNTTSTEGWVPIGDDLVTAGGSGNSVSGTQGQIPEYGTFQLGLQGKPGTGGLNQNLTVGAAGGYLSDLIYNGSSQNQFNQSTGVAQPITQVPNLDYSSYYRDYSLHVDWTQTAPSQPISPVNADTSINSPSVSVSLFGTAAGGLSAVLAPGFGTAAASSAAASGSLTGSAGSGSAADAGSGSATGGFFFDQTPTAATSAGNILPSYAEDTQQLPIPATQQGQDTVDNADRCPHGADRTADLGQSRAIAGPAPAVFERCAKDF